jgi:hypothetical protein
MTKDHLKTVKCKLAIRTNNLSLDKTFLSEAPGVTRPQTPVQSLAAIADECARLAAVDGDYESVITAAKEAVVRVKEWRREQAKKQ